LAAYNATILALADRFWWVPRVVWQYREWLFGLVVGITVVLPGLYTAPLLLLGSSYLFWSLRRNQRRPAGPKFK